MSFNPRCPFHTAVATAAVLAAASLIYQRLFKKSVERFDVDSRFSDAIRFGDLVFISGQLSEESGTIEEETRSALTFVDAALKKAGTDKSKILEVTIWLVDIKNDYDGMNRIYDSWLIPGKPPARACIQATLADSKKKIEIRVIASV
jgi:enamine deaminase RidA (YjgF/YER057c/UK114 family)